MVIEHAAGTAVTQLHSELYRYDANDESLTCVSCTPAGVTPTGSATLGAAGGGSYGPADMAVPMNERRLEGVLPDAGSAGVGRCERRFVRERAVRVDGGVERCV